MAQMLWLRSIHLDWEFASVASLHLSAPLAAGFWPGLEAVAEERVVGRGHDDGCWLLAGGERGTRAHSLHFWMLSLSSGGLTGSSGLLILRTLFFFPSCNTLPIVS